MSTELQQNRTETRSTQRFNLRRRIRATIATAPLVFALALAGCGENANAGGIAPTPIPYTPTETATNYVIPNQIPTQVAPVESPTGQPSLDTHLGSNLPCTTVYPGDVILGDVFINNVWTTDNVANTGQITIVQAEGTACIPNNPNNPNEGADVQRGVTKEPDGGYSTVVHDAEAMQQTGCVDGCQKVYGNYWPNGQQFNPFNP